MIVFQENLTIDDTFVPKLSSLKRLGKPQKSYFLVVGPLRGGGEVNDH